MSTEFLTPIDINKLQADLAAKYKALTEQHLAFLEHQRQESTERRAEYERQRAEHDERFDKRMEESKLEYNRQAEEYNRKFAQLIEQAKETDKRLGGLGSRDVNIVEIPEGVRGYLVIDIALTIQNY